MMIRVDSAGATLQAIAPRTVVKEALWCPFGSLILENKAVEAALSTWGRYPIGEIHHLVQVWTGMHACATRLDKLHERPAIFSCFFLKRSDWVAPLRSLQINSKRSKIIHSVLSRLKFEYLPSRLYRLCELVNMPRC